MSETTTPKSGSSWHDRDTENRRKHGVNTTGATFSPLTTDPVSEPDSSAPKPRPLPSGQGWPKHDLIQEGDYVLLHGSEDTQVVVQATTGGIGRIAGGRVEIGTLVGAPWGSLWQLPTEVLLDHRSITEEGQEASGPTSKRKRVKGKKKITGAPQPLKRLSSLESQVMTSVAKTHPELPSAADNRGLKDDSASQAVSYKTVEALKGVGTAPDEIVGALIAGSTSFSEKTTQSQDKYVRSKAAKYERRFMALRPTAYRLWGFRHLNYPLRVAKVRTDAMVHLIAMASVGPGSRVAVMESTSGLVIGALLERVGPTGKVYALHTGTTSTTEAGLDWFNFPKEQLEQCFVQVPLERWKHLVDPFSPTVPLASEVVIPPPLTEEQVNGGNGLKEARQRRGKLREARLREAAQEMRQGVDAVVILTKYHPLIPVKTLVPILCGGGALVVASQWLEPLTEVYNLLGDAKSMTRGKLTELWSRKYQVLPGASHPAMMMDGASGYVYSAYRVLPNPELDLQKRAAVEAKVAKGDVTNRSLIPLKAPPKDPYELLQVTDSDRPQDDPTGEIMSRMVLERKSREREKQQKNVAELERKAKRQRS